MTRHAWTEADDIAALYLYKYGDGRTVSLDRIANARGVSPGSMRMRVGNFKALDSGGGLRNWARQSESVFERYGQMSEQELSAAIGNRERAADPGPDDVERAQPALFLQGDAP